MKILKNFDSLALRMKLMDITWQALLKPAILINSEMNHDYFRGDSPRNFFLANGNSLLYTIIFLYLNLVFHFFYNSKEKIAFLFYPTFFVIFDFYVTTIVGWYIPIWNSTVLLLVMTGFYLISKYVFAKLKKTSRYSKFLSNVVTFIIFLAMIGKNSYTMNNHKTKIDEYRKWLYVPSFNNNNEFERYFGYKQTALFRTP